MTDLTSLFTGGLDGPGQPMSYRQGVIVTWNAATLANQVLVGGTTLTDVPVLGVAEAASLAPGSVVGLMVVGSTWAIIGRLVVPGTSQATDAITQVSQLTHSATINPAESRSAATWGDVATVGPTCAGVRIGASGRAIVTMSATMVPTFFSAVGVEVSGATTVPPDLLESLYFEGSATIGGSRVSLIAGLAPGGLHTFTMKYISDGSPTSFSGRTLTVEAI